MAKKEASKPAAKPAKKTVAAPALPTPQESARPTAEQVMTVTLSPEGFVLPLREKPPEVFGVFPPAAPLSEIVVTDAAGDAYEEGDIPSEIVVGCEELKPSDDTARDPLASLREWLAEVEDEQGAVETSKLDASHPAIALAQSFQSGSGVPTTEGKVRFHLPAPPDVRRKAKQ